GPVGSTLETFVDIFRDPVTPIRGSILYTDLAFGFAEHSGIYIGNNRIIELNKHGDIAEVSPEEFISGGTGLNIYVSCKGEQAVGSEIAACNAEFYLGGRRNYSFLMDNCHQFVASCFTANTDNACNFLTLLKKTGEDYLGADTWR